MVKAEFRDEQAIPILHTADAMKAVSWYERLGFVQEAIHRFGPDFPAFVTIERNGMRLFLSEHEGDALPDSLVYLRVHDVESMADAFIESVEEAPWAREIELQDPDGNRLRIGTPIE